jgi:hypothetical protein
MPVKLPFTERVAVSLEIESDDGGALSLRVRAVDPGINLEAQRSTVMLTLWCEPPNTLRGRLEDLGASTATYFQGNCTLATFCQKLGIRAVPNADIKKTE